MPTNNFLPFATGGSANVEDQATYSADTLRTNGNQPGVAVSALNNKALRQGTYFVSQLAQFLANVTGTDVLDDAVPTKLLAQLTAAFTILPPKVTTYISGSGSHNLGYVFFIASGNATVGATYTNNAVTYTVEATISAGLVLHATGSGAPLVAGTLTKATGSGDATITFYAVRSSINLEVIMVGGGGGGGPSGTGSFGSSTNATASTFGTALLSAGGGGGAGSATDLGGSGGTASLGTGPTGVALVGADGSSAISNPSATAFNIPGGDGGQTPLGGRGAGGGSSSATGKAAAANTGSGGGGGATGATATGHGGGGGGAGGFVHAFISSPLSTYAYTVGAHGNGAGAGTGGAAGGNGADGEITVIEHYQ